MVSSIHACPGENVMKMIALALVLGTAALQEAGQEKPKVPDDSVQLVVSGCLKGRVLAVSDTRETDTQTGPIVKGKSFRLAGKGDIMKEVKKEDGHYVEVTGIVKRSALDEKGVKVGHRVAVGGGSPVAGKGTMAIPDPVADVAVMDISTLTRRASTCAVQ